MPFTVPDTTTRQVPASALKKLIDGYEVRYQKNLNLLAPAANKGVEVSEPKYRLQEANTVLISARNLKDIPFFISS